MFPCICEKSGLRENRTMDMVRRLCVLTAQNVHLKNYPLNNPVAVFNPSMLVEEEEVVIYARIVLGYFTYSSAIAEIRMSLPEIYSSLTGHFTAEIKLFPNNKFDIWGAEDPRAYRLRERKFITYCGRTVSYFNPAVRTERALPITAVEGKDEVWKKSFLFRMPKRTRSMVISDKDAFLAEIGEEIFFFHRLHMKDEKFYLVVSEVPDEIFEKSKKIAEEEEEKMLPEEVVVRNTKIVIEQENFEDKLGWATPPLKINNKEYLLLIHAVDSEMQSYKVFAILLNEKLEVTAITPCYIMEPREIYEIYGDRPYVVFPCGAEIVDGNLLISYGAADSAIGIGEIDLSELLSLLDSHRIE